MSSSSPDEKSLLDERDSSVSESTPGDLGTDFRLPSFGNSRNETVRPQISDGAQSKDEVHNDIPDNYTLNSSINEVHSGIDPIQLTHTRNTTSSAKSGSSIRKLFNLKKTFTHSTTTGVGSRRRSTILGFRSLRSNTFSGPLNEEDLEKEAERALLLKEQNIAEGLVNLHDHHKGAIDLKSPSVDHGTYLIKEEYDDELNDVNDKFSEIPKNVQTGILSSLLKLYNGDKDQEDSSSEETSDDEIVSDDGFQDLNPSKSMNELDNLRSRFNRKFKSENRSKSPMNLHQRAPRHLLGDSSKSVSNLDLPKFQKLKPKTSKLQKLTHHKKLNKARITVHIADILQRQRFILKLCKTFMLYGAPTHRIEEYLISTARVLEMDANFIYFPGCMIISFGDASTRTSEMHLVRCAQGINLSKLHDVHLIYKNVMHDVTGVDAASEELDRILKGKDLYNNLVLILVNGLSSFFITSWGFRGGWRDMPISFVIGSLIGFLQIIVSPKSNTYSSVFEVTASVLVLFLGRAFGSIGPNKDIFCFSAITQSSLVSILPGYTILCGSLELQSRNIVSGSVRMFYAIIYSLFLGFGIIMGSAIYKWVDSDATSEIVCPLDIQISDYWRIVFVPLFAITQLILGHAKIKQLPIMLFISCASYVAYYFASKHFSSSAEFSLAIGSFIVGILGNLYSRIGQGLAVSAMYPGILLLVPGSIGLKSSLTSGITIADDIVNGSNLSSTNDSSLSFGISMIEVAIGLCVGLIMAALVVYPFGKKRTGLFTL